MSEDEASLDPKKVALFVTLLGMIAFAGWRYWQAREAVAAVAEASKDYRKLFPARTVEAPPVETKPVVAAEAPASGMMLKVDDDMRTPRPAPKVDPPTAPPPEPTKAEAPAAVVKAAVPGVVKPASKSFNRRGLNSGSFSRLNGGAGIGFSGGASSGGGGSAPTTPAAPPAADTK